MGNFNKLRVYGALIAGLLITPYILPGNLSGKETELEAPKTYNITRQGAATVEPGATKGIILQPTSNVKLNPKQLKAIGSIVSQKDLKEITKPGVVNSINPKDIKAKLDKNPAFKGYTINVIPKSETVWVILSPPAAPAKK